MTDITTAAARIAAVEAEVKAFAETVRAKRDELMAEIKAHLDVHSAEADAAKALLARISPATPAAASQVLLTKRSNWLERNWRYLTIGVSAVVLIYYFIHEAHT